MKPRALIALVIANSILSCLSARAAEEIYVFKPLIYVFKNADAQKFSIKSGATVTATKGREGLWLAFRSPATIRFDQEETLALQDEKLTWSNEGAARMKMKLSLISAPSLVSHAGKTATILVGGSTQYFEKLADGNFGLHETPARPQPGPNPDGPYCQLTLSAQSAASAADGLEITFRPDIAAVGAREKIPGVDLDVGKPILAVFQDALKFTAARGAWTALFCQSPGGSDYSLLVLLQVSPQDPTAKRTGQKLVPAARPAQPVGTP